MTCQSFYCSQVFSHPWSPFLIHWPSSDYYNFPTLPSENLRISPLACPFLQYLFPPNQLLYCCPPLSSQRKMSIVLAPPLKPSTSQILRWLKPKHFILQISYDIAYMWNLKKGYKWTYLQNRSRVTDVENKLMVTRGWGGRDKLADWDWQYTHYYT